MASCWQMRRVYSAAGLCSPVTQRRLFVRRNSQPGVMGAGTVCIHSCTVNNRGTSKFPSLNRRRKKKPKHLIFCCGVWKEGARKFLAAEGLWGILHPELHGCCIVGSQIMSLLWLFIHKTLWIWSPDKSIVFSVGRGHVCTGWCCHWPWRGICEGAMPPVTSQWDDFWFDFFDRLETQITDRIAVAQL